MSATVPSIVQREYRQTVDACSPPIALRLRPVIDLMSDQLLEISSLNDDLRFEMTAKGELVIKPLFGGTTSFRSADIAYQLGAREKQHGTGVVLG